MSPLALIGPASYPVAVRRPVGLTLRCFQKRPRGRPLAVCSGPAIKFPEDFYLQVTAHAGHTGGRGRDLRSVRAYLLDAAAAQNQDVSWTPECITPLI